MTNAIPAHVIRVPYICCLFLNHFSGNIFAAIRSVHPIIVNNVMFYLFLDFCSQDRIRTCIYTTMQLTFSDVLANTHCICVTIPPPDCIAGLPPACILLYSAGLRSTNSIPYLYTLLDNLGTQYAPLLQPRPNYLIVLVCHISYLFLICKCVMCCSTRYLCFHKWNNLI